MDDDRLARLRREIAKGEADFAIGRFVTVETDAQLADFFSRLCSDEALSARRDALREAVVIGKQSGIVDDCSMERLIAGLDAGRPDE